jgi:(p)ppGpp synthase/HD superfamily hydrolase
VLAIRDDGLEGLLQKGSLAAHEAMILHRDDVRPARNGHGGFTRMHAAALNAPECPRHGDPQQAARMTGAVAPELGERFRDAVAVALDVHGADRRPGTRVPYLAHLLVVAGLVIEDGGDEDQAIAALLHDAVEAGDGRATLDGIAASFGARVAAIVEACGDAPGGAGDPWIVRKRRYLAHLPYVTDDAVLRVVLADKVNNARSLVRDYRQEGQALWQRFEQRTARDQLWYYGGLLEFFERRRPGR